MDIAFTKLVTTAQTPYHASPDAAGYDLTACSRTWDNEHKFWKYGTGIAVEIPHGFVGLLFPRSSVCKRNQLLANCVGVIDADYRGEIFVVFRDLGAYAPCYAIGERIAQLIILPLPTISFREVAHIGQTARQDAGFGSTDR